MVIWILFFVSTVGLEKGCGPNRVRPPVSTAPRALRPIKSYGVKTHRGPDLSGLVELVLPWIRSIFIPFFAAVVSQPLCVRLVSCAKSSSPVFESVAQRVVLERSILACGREEMIRGRRLYWAGAYNCDISLVAKRLATRYYAGVKYRKH